MLSKVLDAGLLGPLGVNWGCLKATWELLGESPGVAWGSLGESPGATWGSVEGHLGSVGGPNAPRASPLAFGGDSTAGRGSGGTDRVASVRPRGGLKEASRRQRRTGRSRLRSTSYYETKF